jgi:hypothetical protein
MNRFVIPFAAFAALGLLGVLSMVPSLGPTLARLKAMPGAPLQRSDAVWTILLLAQPGVLVIAGALIGVLLAERVGLPSLLLSALRGTPKPPVTAVSLLIAVMAGVFAAVTILAIDIAVKSAVVPNFAALARAQMAAGTVPPAPAMAQALLYGGIAEEIMLRFGLMTLLVFFGAWIAPAFYAERPAWIIGAAIVISALLFGAGHLPAVAAFTPLTPGIVLRIVGLNAIGGLVYGWLYARYGLEHAMLAHMTTHVGFWTLTPVILRLVV